MAGIAAWYVLKRRNDDVVRMSLRLAVISSLVATALVFATGDRHAKQVARTQQAKFAAMEGLYSTQNGAPMVLFSLPPQQHGKPNGPELVVTNLTSFLAFGNFQAPVKGLEEFPKEEWPPIAVTFLSFHNMVIIGNLMLLIALGAAIQMWRQRLEHSRRTLAILFWSLPLPTLAIQLGWMGAEVGRQPWIVYGVMKTSDGVSKVVPAGSILFSIILFALIYALLGAFWIYLLRKEILHGPAGEPVEEEPIPEAQHWEPAPAAPRY